MQDFRVSNVVPPGGRYFYEVPETRVFMEDFTLTQLLTRVTAHYAQNHLPVPEALKETVTDFMCRRLPQGFCTGDGPPVGIRIFTVADIRERSRRQAALSTGFALPAEAVERAKICANCPKNDRSICPTCSGMVAWAVRLVGGRTSGFDEVLGICGIYGVMIPSQVFLNTPADKADRPEDCWRKES